MFQTDGQTSVKIVVSVLSAAFLTLLMLCDKNGHIRGSRVTIFSELVKAEWCASSYENINTSQCINWKTILTCHGCVLYYHFCWRLRGHCQNTGNLIVSIKKSRGFRSDYRNSWENVLGGNTWCCAACPQSVVQTEVTSYSWWTKWGHRGRAAPPTNTLRAHPAENKISCMCITAL